MNVLIIDDSQADRDTAISHLEELEVDEQTNITEAESLTSGIVMLKQYDYDIIILDLALPEADGIDTITKVFTCLQSQKKVIPIIIMTGSGDYKMGKRAYKMGITDYIIKGSEEREDEKKNLRRAISFATYPRNLPTKSRTF